MLRPFDATVTAQIALSAVARLEEKFDEGYVIGFLLGSKSEKIASQHRALKTFGAGAGQTKQEWLNHIRELVSRGYLKRSSDGSPALRISEKGWRVLRGEEKVSLDKSSFGNKIGFTKHRRERAPEFEPDLLDELKKVRKYLASKYEVDADDVIPYLRLHQMATYLPATTGHLQAIAGFDDRKMSSYGSPFLKVILEYLEINGLQSRMDLKRRG